MNDSAKTDVVIEDSDAYDLFCVVTSLYLQHTNHVPEPFEGEKIVLHRMSDIIHHKNVFDTLKRFLRSVGGGSASLMRVQKILSDSFRFVVFNDIALRNTIAKVRENDTDAHSDLERNES